MKRRGMTCVPLLLASICVISLNGCAFGPGEIHDETFVEAMRVSPNDPDAFIDILESDVCPGCGIGAAQMRLVELGEGAIPALSEHALDVTASRQSRFGCAQALGEIGTEAAIETLVRLASSEDAAEHEMGIAGLKPLPLDVRPQPFKIEIALMDIDAQVIMGDWPWIDDQIHEVIALLSSEPDFTAPDGRSGSDVLWQIADELEERALIKSGGQFSSIWRDPEEFQALCALAEIYDDQAAREMIEKITGRPYSEYELERPAYVTD